MNNKKYVVKHKNFGPRYFDDLDQALEHASFCNSVVEVLDPLKAIPDFTGQLAFDHLFSEVKKNK